MPITALKRIRSRRNRSLKPAEHESKKASSTHASGPLLAQQAIGNQAVQRMLQAKLTVNPPDDEQEKEADQAADTIMRMPEPGMPPSEPEKDDEEKRLQAKPLPGQNLHMIQRVETEKNEDEVKKPLQTKPLSGQDALIQREEVSGDEEKKKKDEETSIQTKSSSGQSQSLIQREAGIVADEEQKKDEEEGKSIQTKIISGQVPRIQREDEDEKEEGNIVAQPKTLDSTITPLAQLASSNQLKSPASEDDFESWLNASDSGSPLPLSTRSFMESRFGAEFSDVRLHTGSDASRLNRALSSRAFTQGRDIYFGEGKNDIESSTGKHLLAHELTHTIQQGVTRTLGTDATHAKQTVARLSPSSLSAQRRRGQRKKTDTEWKADFVKEQVELGRFKDLSIPVPEGSPAPGGAFWMLNGLNPAEMLEVLRLCGKDTRTKLLAHIADAEGRFDRPRLESALRSSSWGEKNAGIQGLEVMDAIRNAGAGSFSGVWGLLAGKSRLKIIGALRTLPRPMLSQLQSKLSEAPAADVTKFTEVIADLLGTGTNMQANDVIDLEGLSGLDRVMASIYNLRGQLIEEQARNLGVPTHAAAGIMKVESGGATFGDTTDRTIIRFENHKFWKEWGRHNAVDFNAHFDFDRTPRNGFRQHRFRESTTGAWEASHQSQEQEWRIIEFAAGLSGNEPAYRSASWGAGQIMGSNARTVGYSSAEDMAAAFNRAERPQVTGIFEYIRANHLAPAILRGDYLAVARGYNGRGQAPTYAALIESASQAYQRVTRGKIHVIP